MHRQHAAGLLRLAALAGLGQVAAGCVPLLGVERGDGGVEVGHRIVGIGGHGYRHGFVELIRTRFVALRHKEHLLKRRILRRHLHHLDGLLDGERAHHILHRVVRVTQCRIHVGKHRAVALREAGLQRGVLGVGLHVGVDDA